MTPNFPPLFSGLAVENPFAAACAKAQEGCDAGLVCYDLAPDTLRAAVVFAPEMPLQDAVLMLPLCAVGFQNALGALGPPELPVQLAWDGGAIINGARCGGLAMAASTDDPKAEPDWLIVGLELPLWPASDNPGDTPDQTALYAEGCADIDAARLLEAWIKHSLVGLNRWTDEGAAALHRDWIGLAHGVGDPVPGGVFLGVDERFGMLVKGDDSQVIPLTTLLEDT